MYPCCGPLACASPRERRARVNEDIAHGVGRIHVDHRFLAAVDGNRGDAQGILFIAVELDLRPGKGDDRGIIRSAIVAHRGIKGSNNA